MGLVGRGRASCTSDKEDNGLPSGQRNGKPLGVLMTDRPFRDYSEAELIELLHDRQGNVSYWRGQERAFRKEYGGKADGDRWMYEDEDYQSIEHEIKRSVQEVSDVQAEFTARRKDREERRFASERPPGSVNNGGLVPLVCSCRAPSVLSREFAGSRRRGFPGCRRRTWSR
jgi:hypothetical protein